jgi:hypothetical protein
MPNSVEDLRRVLSACEAPAFVQMAVLLDTFALCERLERSPMDFMKLATGRTGIRLAGTEREIRPGKSSLG